MNRDAMPWSRVSELIAERLGLHFPAERLVDLQRGFGAAAAELGLVDADACAARLLADGLDTSQMRALATHLTVGETYFLRGDETFAALRDHVLPGLIRARAGNRRLRVWSAACATGEEAYSLAIVLRQLLPDVDQWDVEILATDIDPHALRRAREGVYGGWSFRGTSAAFRDRWFRRRRDGRHVLVPEVARMVRFAPLNLVADAPPPVSGGGPVDLVLCRNVLMYFTPPQARRAVAGLRRAIAGDGWLVVAPCEVSQTLFRDFEPVRFEGAILYRQPVRNDLTAPAAPAPAPAPAAVAASIAPAPAPIPSPAVTRHRAATRPRPRTIAVRPAAPVVAVTPSDATALAARARSLADQGRLTEALECCDLRLEADRLDADAHYLRAMILTELGRPGDAATALQRCIYLDPDAPMGSFAFGNLERGLGRHQAAERHYRHALHLLRNQPPERMLDHADGITAAQLGALIVDLLGQERRA